MRGMFDIDEAPLLLVTSTLATLVCELEAPLPLPLPLVMAEPVRVSTGVLSSGTLEQAASEATARALRRWRWIDFMVVSFFPQSERQSRRGYRPKGPQTGSRKSAVADGSRALILPSSVVVINTLRPCTFVA